MKKIKAVIFGVGNRGKCYGGYAIEHPDELEIVQVMDTNATALEYAKKLFTIKFEVLRCNKWFDDLNASNSNIVDYQGIAVEVVRKSTEIEI